MSLPSSVPFPSLTDAGIASSSSRSVGGTVNIAPVDFGMNKKGLLFYAGLAGVALFSYILIKKVL